MQSPTRASWARARYMWSAHATTCTPRHPLGVLELLQQLGGDRQVVTSGQSGDLANVSERGAHDDRLVSVLLVVVEDLLDRLDSWVGLRVVLLSSRLLVPVEDLLGGVCEGWLRGVQSKSRCKGKR
jgi:hypothetical protein